MPNSSGSCGLSAFVQPREEVMPQREAQPFGQHDPSQPRDNRSGQVVAQNLEDLRGTQRQHAAHVPRRQADERVKQRQRQAQRHGLQPTQPAHHYHQIGQQQGQRAPRQQIQR